MSFTKRQIIEAAFGELALAGYVFDISPEEMMAAVGRLDMMMALWGKVGQRLGYSATLDPLAADPDQDSGLPDWSIEPVVLNLAIRLAAGYGKALARSTTAIAKQGYDLLCAQTVSVPQMQPMGNLPIGAGFKNRWRPAPFANQPADRLTTGQDGLLDMNGPVDVGALPS